MPRKSRAKKCVAEDSAEDIKCEKSEAVRVDDIKEEIIKEETIKIDSVQNEINTSLLPATIHIPFLDERSEEIPTYVVEISKSARAVW